MLESKVPTAEPIGVVKRKLIASKMGALRNRDCCGAFLDVVCVHIMRILGRCRYCTLVP